MCAHIRSRLLPRFPKALSYLRIMKFLVWKGYLVGREIQQAVQNRWSSFLSSVNVAVSHLNLVLISG